MQIAMAHYMHVEADDENDAEHWRGSDLRRSISRFARE